VSRCTDAELDELQVFQRRVYGDASPVLDPERARWLFGRNPAVSPGELAIWIARHNGAIVGTHASIPVRLELGDQECQAQSGVDVLADPAWRGKGVMDPLVAAVVAGYRVWCLLGMTEEGYRFALRLGSVPLGTVPVYAHLIEPQAVLSEAALSRPWLRAAIPFTWVAGALGGLASQLRGIGADPVAIDAFDERADAIWRDASPSYRLITRRDATWLRWRFDDGPYRDRFRRWYVVRGKRTVGYFVLRLRRWHGEAAYTVVDYLCAPRDLGALFACAVRVAQRDDVAALLCPTLNPFAGARLRSVGFLRLRQASRVIRFAAWCEADDPARYLVVDRESWFITAANSDVDEYFDE